MLHLEQNWLVVNVEIKTSLALQIFFHWNTMFSVTGLALAEILVSIAVSHRAVTGCFFVWLSLFEMQQTEGSPIYISISFEGPMP